jgi:hypothetical protein
MLFRCFGVNPEKSNCGFFRQRASTQLAVVRLERLEDRFLLSRGSMGGLSDLDIRPDLTSPAETDRSSQAPGPISSAFQQVNVASGTTSVCGHAGVGGADLPASGQQEAAAESSSNKQKGGNNSGSSGAPGSSEKSGSVESGSATTVISVNEPLLTTGSTFSFSPAAGCVTSSQPSSILLSGATPPTSISVPLPMPPGVPAGGIFKQVAVQTTNANLGVLSLDPVAVDLSPSSFAPAGASGLAVAMHGSQPASFVAQAATTTLRLSTLQSSLGSSLASRLVDVPIELAARPGRQRAVLPDVAALAPEKVPRLPASNAVGNADPELPNGPIAELTLSAQTPIAAVLSPGMAGHGDSGQAETGRKEHRLPAQMAIYSAVSLTVAVSAPGLTSVIRRGRGRDKQRLNVVPDGRAPGSPR